MAIPAATVKELREKTGAGMMDCQRALQEASGDIEEAIKILRKKGLSAAAKKAGRTAKDGLVAVAVSPDASKGAVVEVNCETDFVARTERYQVFARALVEQALEEGIADAPTMLAKPFKGDPSHTVQQEVAAQIATIGENILLSRATTLLAGEGMKIGSYLHMGGKIGVLVAISASADEETVKGVAMHVAAAEPRFVSRDQVPASVIAEEREIARAQAEAAGKPAQVLDKIADGKVGKYYEQNCLLEQPFVKDPEQTVAAMLAAQGGVVVTAFVRYRLGEVTAAVAE
jgi:elongation factor Ts